MVVVLVIFLLISLFEIIHLIRTKNKKEIIIYSFFAAMTIALGLYLVLVPEYKSLAKLILNLFNVESD